MCSEIVGLRDIRILVYQFKCSCHFCEEFAHCKNKVNYNFTIIIFGTRFLVPNEII